MKILICGGHVTPALEVIKVLQKENEILYVGRKHPLEGDKALSLEYQLVKKNRISFAEIETGRLQRTINVHNVALFLKFPKGFFQALHIINSFSPDVIVGFGSYVSLPICFIGRIKKIPIIIHEQTLGAGLANRIISRFATAVCISWESSKKFLPTKHIYITGNPAVESYFSIKTNSRPSINSIPKILIIGGSQGSHAINILIENTLSQLLSIVTIVHQTGDAKEFRDFERLQEYKKSLPIELQNRYELVKFFDPADIVLELASADIVVTRGGINTILGLLIINTPALVIPLDISSQDEQRKNAELIKQAGLGEIAYQNSLTPELFFTLLSKMLHNIKSYVISESYKRQLEKNKNAAEKVAKVILKQAAYRNTKKA